MFSRVDPRTEAQIEDDKNFEKMAWRVIMHRKLHKLLKEWH